MTHWIKYLTDNTKKKKKKTTERLILTEMPRKKSSELHGAAGLSTLPLQIPHKTHFLLKLPKIFIEKYFFLKKIKRVLSYGEYK